MNDDDPDVAPDDPAIDELDLAPDELDARASAQLDGIDEQSRTGNTAPGRPRPRMAAQGETAPLVENDPALARRVADFAYARSLVVDVPGPPAGSLDAAVNAALEASRHGESDAGLGRENDADADAGLDSDSHATDLAPVLPLAARRSRRLLPLGAAALVAVALGVVALAGRGADETDQDVAAEASRAATAIEQTESATLGDSDAPPAAPTTTITASAGPTALAGGSSPSAGSATVSLGTFPSLADLDATLRSSSPATVGSADTTATPATSGASTPSPAAPAPSQAPTAPPAPAAGEGSSGAPAADSALGSQNGCGAGTSLGTAVIGGLPVEVVRRPDGSLASFDAACVLVDATPPSP